LRVDTVSTHQAVKQPPASLETQQSSIPFDGPLGDAIDQVNQLQLEADRQAENLALGRADNIHEAVIALEKANLALQFTIQVTKKALEAYNDILHMQI